MGDVCNPHAGSEAGGQGVAADSGGWIHGSDDLDPLHFDELKVLVIVTCARESIYMLQWKLRYNAQCVLCTSTRTYHTHFYNYVLILRGVCV